MPLAKLRADCYSLLRPNHHLLWSTRKKLSGAVWCCECSSTSHPTDSPCRCSKTGLLRLSQPELRVGAPSLTYRWISRIAWSDFPQVCHRKAHLRLAIVTVSPWYACYDLRWFWRPTCTCQICRRCPQALHRKERYLDASSCYQYVSASDWPRSPWSDPSAWQSAALAMWFSLAACRSLSATRVTCCAACSDQWWWACLWCCLLVSLFLCLQRGAWDTPYFSTKLSLDSAAADLTLCRSDCARGCSFKSLHSSPCF